MAVDKRQSFFRNEIGVNRGSGFTNAANQKLDDARAFDKIVDVVAKREKENLLQIGEAQAEEAARQVGYVFETLDDGTKVPMLPEVPEYLTGKTSRAKAEKLIFERYARDVQSQVESIISSTATEAKFERQRPDVYEAEVLGRLEPLLDTVKGTLGESIRSFAIDKINQYEYNVATVYDTAHRNFNKVEHQSTAQDINNKLITQIYSTRQYDSNLRQSYEDSLSGTGITEEAIKLKMEEFDSIANAHKYIGNTFFSYFNKSSKNRGVNNRAGADVRELINFIKTPSEQILTLSDGKTFTRDEINNNITTEAARKDVLKILRNYKSIYSNSTSLTRGSDSIFTMINRSLETDDGMPNHMNPNFQADVKTTYKTHSKDYADNQSLIFDRYNKEVAIPNNLQQVRDGVVTEDFKKYSIRTLRMLPPDEYNQFLSQVKTGRITDSSFNSFVTMYDVLEDSNFMSQPLDISSADYDKIISFGVLYKNNNFDRERTIKDFNQIMESRPTIKVNEIIYNLSKQGPEQGDTFIGTVIDKELRKGEYKSLPFAKTRRLVSASVKNLVALTYAGDYNKSEADFVKEFVKPSIGKILSNTHMSPTNDETPIGQTFSTVNKGIQLTGRGEKDYAEDPAEYHYGIDYSELEFVDPNESTEYRLKYLSDFFNTNPYKGMYIKALDKNNNEIDLKVGAEERGMEHYFLGKVKLLPMTNFYTEKPDYKLVYLQEVKLENGETRLKMSDILTNEKPIILSEEQIEDLKADYIKKITTPNG